MKISIFYVIYAIKVYAEISSTSSKRSQKIERSPEIERSSKSIYAPILSSKNRPELPETSSC